MYLKSLQLVGFKSFAERTELEFLPGVTAIVGPNGCGKSNVADAIRWVLGEQSAKALRGAEMADVIFSGTDGRKPIGMAEVSMTFAEVDPSTLTLPGVKLDFSEVTITRRVYRDGAGEYLINKTPCRLRDIQGMFMDTGIGRSSYSLMAQGQIDQILSAHPEDRRLIFEEAAGISKYKHQKKEALRKLEYTEANLVRLTDVIREVKRQIISLQRQAGKARRYKELFDQLKALDIRLARHKYDLLQAELAGLEAQIADCTGKTEQFTAEITGRETQIADLRRSLAEMDRAISEAVNRDHAHQSESDRHQQRIGSNTERIAEMEQLIANHHREMAGSDEKIRVQEEELARLNAEFAEIDSALAAEQAKLAAEQDVLRHLEAECSQKIVGVNTAQAALLDLESGMSRHRNELGALDHKKKHDLLRAERLSTEKLHLEDQRREMDQRRLALDAELAGLRDAVGTPRSVLTGHETDLTSLTRDLTEITAAYHASVSEVSKKAARLDVLRQMFGATDGRVTLAGILDVEPQYRVAIEAALNHALRTILADDLTSARALLAGNAVTAPEMACPRGPSNLVEGKRAVSVVRVKDSRFESLVQSLLANIVLAGTLEEALAIRSVHPQWAVATERGEFLSEHGILSALAAGPMAEMGVLADQLAVLQQRVTELAAQKTRLEQRKVETEQTLHAVREDWHAKQVALASKEGESGVLASAQRDLESKVHTVVFELASIEQQDTEEKAQRARILETLCAAEANEGPLREQLAAARQSIDAFQARREQQSKIITELRVSVGGFQHKRQAIEVSRDPIAGRVRDLRERIQVCATEITGYTAKMEQFRQENAESEQKMAELKIAREQACQQMSGFQHQRAEVATGIEQAEEELRGLRQQASGAQQQKSALDIQHAQKRMEADNLKERVLQKYQVNLEELPSDTMTITVADQGPVISEQVALLTDWDAIESQVAEIQSKLDAMGPVNVEAIQEYDELEERYKFLSQQHEDLVKAKEQLLQVIAKINTTTKQLFNDTFLKVRENFQMMFTELFGGGKANLILLDENDPLESGIEIVAKPPGKQLQSITLLSGGEKTLTATALLFSIYMVKPSPFCVLDELDAPLDESNINRFVRILTRFIQQSQFVIITHNKRTIGMADALYGITMEEHGVSKVVSVKFSPREEKARKDQEKQRGLQAEQIDGAAVLADVPLPHEEELRNDLLVAKEQTVAPIEEAAPVMSEIAPTLDNTPVPMADEVKAAVAAAVEAAESVKETVAEIAPTQA